MRLIHSKKAAASAFVAINQTLRSSKLFMNKYEAERVLNVFAVDRVFLPSRIFLLASNFVINSYKNVRFLWFYTSTLSHPSKQQNCSE